MQGCIPLYANSVKQMHVTKKSKPFIGELIKIRYNFKVHFVEAIEAFTDMTKLVESIGLVESVL